MNSANRRVNYTHSNSYEILNSRSEKTKNIWLVFHGMGYLSRYFLKYFKGLDQQENYIIAPQAPSKYYMGPDFKHVGASWLTREDTLNETENILNYVDAVAKAEELETSNLILMGYSQGVSIACRWMATRKIQPKMVVLHSGGIPVELTASQFEYLDTETPVYYIYGDTDQYITPERVEEQSERGVKLFADRLSIHNFAGGHQVNTQYLDSLAKTGRL